jgi:exodeoxyribonuclease VII large subunit
LEEARDRLILSMERLLVPCRHRLDLLSQAVGSSSPLAVLERGYAVVSRERDDQVLLASGQVEAAENVKIRLHRGRLRAEVKEKEE